MIPVLEQVLEKYPDQVKVVFKNFPLRNHKYARKAAAAALAANNQGKFWKFNEELLKNGTQLNDQKVLAIARELGLNEEKFQTDWKDPKRAGEINKDVQDGIKAGVRGTPTIFVNGKLVKQRTLEQFGTMIEKELKKKTSGE